MYIHGKSKGCRSKNNQVMIVLRFVFFCIFDIETSERANNLLPVCRIRLISFSSSSCTFYLYLLPYKIWRLQLQNWPSYDKFPLHHHHHDPVHFIEIYYHAKSGGCSYKIGLKIKKNDMAYGMSIKMGQKHTKMERNIFQIKPS